jgi:hypothetical protein
MELARASNVVDAASAAIPKRTSRLTPSRATSSLVKVAEMLASRNDSVLAPEIRATG